MHLQPAWFSSGQSGPILMRSGGMWLLLFPHGSVRPKQPALSPLCSLPCGFGKGSS